MLPQRSIIPDPELNQDARREPVRVPLAGPGKLDDPARDKFGFVISRTDGKLKPRTRNVECLAHGFNVLGVERESMGRGSWHRGAYRCGATLSPADELRRPDPKGKSWGQGQYKAVFGASGEPKNSPVRSA
jgi:hypothetical protein